MAQFEPEPLSVLGISNPEILRLAEYLFRQLLELAKLSEGVERVSLVKLNVEPEKKEDGQVEYADGTNWNPGSGAGVYFWNGTTWKFLG